MNVNPWFEHVCGSAQSVPLFSQFFTQHDQSNTPPLRSCRGDGPQGIEGVGRIQALGPAGHGNTFSFSATPCVAGQRERNGFGSSWFGRWNIGSLFVGFMTSQQGVDFFGARSWRKINDTPLDPTCHVRVDGWWLGRWTEQFAGTALDQSGPVPLQQPARLQGSVQKVQQAVWGIGR